MLRLKNQFDTQTIENELTHLETLENIKQRHNECVNYT
jgi:hypothetical protein